MSTTTMKKFRGMKPFRTIKRQCEKAGVALDDYGARTTGADYVCLGRETVSKARPDGSPFVNASALGNVMFNTFNGRFFGRTPQGIRFCSDDTTCEHEPWFQALLAFFYTDDAPAPRKSTMVELILGTAV